MWYPLEHNTPNNGIGWVFNNTVDNLSLENCSAPYAYVYGIDNGENTSFVTEIDYYNNIVTEISGDAAFSVYGILDDDVSDYSNLWHCLKGGNESPWANPADEGIGCLYEDPMYSNNTTEPYNYNLDTGSPCIGTGADSEDMGCWGGLNPGETIGLLSPED